MPYQVKKILNRAYLEDKPYNDIVLHLKKEMRLNGLGAPDEVTLVPLNKIEPTQTQTETKPTQNTTQNTNKKGTAFTAIKLAISRENAEKGDETSGNRQENTMAKPQTALAPPSNAILVENPTKQKTAGMELTRQTTRDLNGISNEREKQIVRPNNRRTKSAMNKKN